MATERFDSKKSSLKMINFRNIQEAAKKSKILMFKQNSSSRSFLDKRKISTLLSSNQHELKSYTMKTTVT